MKLSDLLKTRDRLKVEASKIVEAAEKANRAPEEREQARLDEIRAEVDQLETRIRNQALVDELERREAGGRVIETGEDREWSEHLRSFSLNRLLASTFDPSIDAAREREIVAEQATRSGKTPEGFLIPFEVLAPRRRAEQRVLTVAGDAGNLVSTDVLGAEFIDALRPLAVTTRLGARTITGLRGDIALPRRDARTPTAAWFAENDVIGTGDQSFDQVPGTPRHLGLITEFSRKALLQTTPGIEEITRSHILAELAIGLDLGVLKGAGAPAPTGITATANIGTRDSAGGAPDWDDVVAIQATVEGADVPPEALGWALNADVKAKLRGTLRVGGDAGAGFILGDDGRLGGAPVAVTSMLAGAAAGSPTIFGEAIYGAWNQVIVAMWSGIEVLVNPYETTAYARGNVSVRGILDADVLVRYPRAFAHWQNIALA